MAGLIVLRFQNPMDFKSVFALHVITSFLLAVQAYNGYIPLGVIFDQTDVASKRAFDMAFNVHNNSRRDPLFRFNVTRDVIDTQDNFQLVNAICRQMKWGVFAILGQKCIQSNNIVQALTSTFNMPFITPSLTNSSTEDANNSFEIHLRPDLTWAMVDVIEHLGWNQVHFLYDSDEGLNRLQNIHRRMRNDSVQWFSMLRFSNINDVHDDLRMADNADGVDNNTFRLKAFVLDLSSEEAYATVLRQIPEVGMNKYGYRYLLGTLDFMSLNLTRFRHGGVNVTGFQLLNSDKERNWSRAAGIIRTNPALPNQYGLPVQAALTVDGLRVMEEAINGLLMENPAMFKGFFRRRELYNNDKTRGIPCDSKPPEPWMFGREMMDAIKAGSSMGYSGNLSFTEEGARKEYELGVYTMHLDSRVSMIGTWSPKNRFSGSSYRKGEEPTIAKGRQAEHNANVTIISIYSAPFLMPAPQKEGDPKFTGNKQFIGYSMDLAENLAKLVGFNFQIRIVEDGSYGKLDNHTWNGIIGELLDGKGDLAVAPLTITADRERYVDFSKPFMEIGVTIMIKKPQSQRPGVFSFMEPLSVEVWVCICVAYVIVSVALFLVSRFSPIEWTKIKDAGEDYHNEFSLFNSFWFSMGALMFQGSDSCPRSVSGRIIGGAWWFFVLIIISSYTANLAAFLTIERMISPIESVQDLANHPTIKYGAIASGTTLQYFLDSDDPVHRMMGEYMLNNNEVLVQSNEEGYNRVQESKGKYAFLSESSAVEYINNQKPCETLSVGGKLNHKGFGVATPRNSKYRDPINVAVLKLKEDGTLYRMYQNWWIEKGQCGENLSGSKKGKLSLTLNNVAGIFYILIVGLVFAIMLGVFEFMCFRATHKSEDTVAGGYNMKATDTHTTLCNTPSEREESATLFDYRPSAQTPSDGHGPGYIGFEKLQVDMTEDR